MVDSQRFLSRMLVSAINAREQESDRISRKLHDEVGQVLSAVGLQLHALKLEFQDRVPDLVESTNKIQSMLEVAMSEVRALSYDLNPSVVERVGLQYALDRLIGRFREEFKGSLRYNFDSSVRVPLDIGNAWYKITEHAIENAVRHSQAGKIEVQVKPSPKTVLLEIKDNGTGFPLEETRAKSPGLGLHLMEHYASQASLKLQLISAAGKGTTVRCSCPSARCEPSAQPDARIRGFMEGRVKK